MSEQPSTNADSGAASEAAGTTDSEERREQSPAERHSAEWGEQDS